MPKKKTNGSIPSTPQISAQIHADVKPDTPFYYVNYMAINHSPYDFTITAIKLPSHLATDQIESAKKGKPVSIEPVLQLVVPPRVIKGLIKALTEQCRKYEALFGPIPAEGESK
jgi:hypothetical protein